MWLTFSLKEVYFPSSLKISSATISGLTLALPLSLANKVIHTLEPKPFCLQGRHTGRTISKIKWKWCLINIWVQIFPTFPVCSSWRAMWRIFLWNYLTSLSLSLAGLWDIFVEYLKLILCCCLKLSNHPSEKWNDDSGSICSSSCLPLVLNQKPFTFNPCFWRDLYFC